MLLADLVTSTSVTLRPSSFGMSFCLQQRGTKAGDEDTEFVLLVSTYLVINCNELSHHMKNIFACIHNWSCRLSNETIQCFLLPCLLPHSFVFHLPPNYARDCPMVLQYVCCFASFFVYCIMLMNVLPTGGVTTSVECLLLS